MTMYLCFIFFAHFQCCTLCFFSTVKAKSFIQFEGVLWTEVVTMHVKINF